MEKLKTIVIKGENYVIYESLAGYELTTEKNYNAYITDANKILQFTNANGFKTFDDVINYIKKYF